MAKKILKIQGKTMVLCIFIILGLLFDSIRKICLGFGGVSQMGSCIAIVSFSI